VSNANHSATNTASNANSTAKPAPTK
jgi:hypothetical protein